MSEHIQAVFTQVTGQYRVNFDDGDKIYVKIPVSAVAPAGLNALLFTVVGLRSGRGQIQHRPGGRRAAVDCAPRLHSGIERDALRESRWPLFDSAGQTPRLRDRSAIRISDKKYGHRRWRPLGSSPRSHTLTLSLPIYLDPPRPPPLSAAAAAAPRRRRRR